MSIPPIFNILETNQFYREEIESEYDFNLSYRSWCYKEHVLSIKLDQIRRQLEEYLNQQPQEQKKISHTLCDKQRTLYLVKFNQGKIHLEKVA